MMNMRQTIGNRAATRPAQHAARAGQAARSDREARAGPRRLWAWLASRIRSAGRRLFLADDARAIASGWQITHGRWGLSRTYRDPRFDMLASCAVCGGEGKTADRPCTRCAGTGRITLMAGQAQQREPERDR